jgi:hypothetical protein
MFARFVTIGGAVVCPSRQTLDLAFIECEIALQCRGPSNRRCRGPARGGGALNNTRVALARAVRPLAAGEPARRARGFLQRQRGLSVLWRPAHRRFASNGPRRPNGGVCSSAVPSLTASQGRCHTQPGVGAVSPRSCVWLPLRGVGAFADAVKSLLMLPAILVPSFARSNPSVEGTHNGGARSRASATTAAPSCVPHLKR